MKARIEKMNVYADEDIMLVAPCDEMRNFAIFMACAMYEAEQNAKDQGRIHTAAKYKNLARNFSKIANSIEDERIKK